MNGLTRSLRMTLLACAGVGTFYAAAHWSREQRNAQGEIVEAVTSAPGGASGAAPQAALDATAAAVAASAVPPAAASAALAGASAPPPALADAAAPAPTSAAASAPQNDALLSVANRSRSIPGTLGSLFANMSWLPPPPPPPPPPPAPPPKPAAPVAPPLPFTFVGMLERGAAKPQAFLAKGDALLVVAAGDLLDNNTYRVDSLNESQVVMTYLPMNIQQTLSVPGGTK
jgi:hypothetical protein